MIAGRYSLERELGHGGMGAVWLGSDDVLGREVALKQLTPAAAGGATTARAAREARLAARLNHPNVVAVFDLVEEGSQPWLVMEYVEGSSLAQLINEFGPLSPADAATVLVQIADGLRAAHAAGVVHRDVKPSNILVTREGLAKLTDFGVARGTESDATLTQTGLVTGSPAYLAPEVASGSPATPASDAWSLGATLFHIVTGRPPYDVSDNVLGTLYRIVHDAPPRTDRAGWLTPLLDHTMTHDPAQRWDLDRIHDFLSHGEQPVEGTRILTPVAAASAASVPAVPPPTPAPAPAPSGASDASGSVPTGGVRRTMRSPRALIAVAGVLALLVVIVLVVLLATRGNPDRSGPAATAGNSTHPKAGHSPSRSASRTPSSAPSKPKPSHAPTADGVRAFVTKYLTTAATHPSRGYTMLTPQFQVASGGLSGYRGFWGHVQRVDRVAAIRPEMGDDLGVGYRYTYTTDDGRAHTENVHLRLVYDHGRYLIAGD